MQSSHIDWKSEPMHIVQCHSLKCIFDVWNWQAIYWQANIYIWNVCTPPPPNTPTLLMYMLSFRLYTVYCRYLAIGRWPEKGRVHRMSWKIIEPLLPDINGNKQWLEFNHLTVRILFVCNRHFVYIFALPRLFIYFKICFSIFEQMLWNSVYNKNNQYYCNLRGIL